MAEPRAQNALEHLQVFISPFFNRCLECQLAAHIASSILFSFSLMVLFFVGQTSELCTTMFRTYQQEFATFLRVLGCYAMDTTL